MSDCNWVDVSEAIGLWITGGLGAWFVWRQNSILHRQNEIMTAQNGLMEKQNETLANQRELNQLLIQQELARGDEAIKLWCKNAFRSHGDSPGRRQSTGTSLRQRFPTSVPLIIKAYEELLNQEPNLKLPSLYDFLREMNGDEPGKWPEASEYWQTPRL